jgi:hypothetical protein
MALPQGLFANLAVLADRGVLVPTTARHELSPQAVRHHLLAWSFDPEGDHPHDAGVWTALADEVTASDAHTALISSELLAAVAVDPATGPLLGERLLSLSDDVTVAFLVREPLGLLNSLYAQRVRALELTCDFETYLASSSDVALCRLAESFRPWYDAENLRFVAMPWNEQPDSAALPALLRLCGIDVPLEALTTVEDTERDELGAVGVETTRMLGSYLRGKFANFQFGEPAARRLRRRAAAMAEAYGWCTEDFWGWQPERAAAFAGELAQSNEQFARLTWGGDWTLSPPTDRPRQVADFVELPPTAVNRAHHYFAEMADAFKQLRLREAGV